MPSECGNKEKLGFVKWNEEVSFYGIELGLNIINI